MTNVSCETNIQYLACVRVVFVRDPVGCKTLLTHEFYIELIDLEYPNFYEFELQYTWSRLRARKLPDKLGEIYPTLVDTKLPC